MDTIDLHWAAWSDKQRQLGGTDTLLQYGSAGQAEIDLTHVHPSGLAQLFAGRPTLLSTLIRRTREFSDAYEAANSILSKSHELLVDRNLGAVYLAFGLASWTGSASDVDLIEPEAEEESPEKPRRLSRLLALAGLDFDGAAERELRPKSVGTDSDTVRDLRKEINSGEEDQEVSYSAPVLLVPVSVKRKPGHSDLVLQLSGPPVINAPLARYMSSVFNLAIGGDALLRLARARGTFDPEPVLERMRFLTRNIEGFTIDSKVFVSTFADLRETQPLDKESSSVELLQALAGDSRAIASINHSQYSTDFVHPDDRDPAQEFLLVDADDQQQAFLDTVAAGNHAVLKTPPGTGFLPSVLNTVSVLAAQHKSVLVLGEHRTTFLKVAKGLSQAGLGNVSLTLNQSTQLQKQLISAIKAHETAEPSRSSEVQDILVHRRKKLATHIRALHDTGNPWNLSPSQVMQALARLTSKEPAPVTKVRLSKNTLEGLTDREKAVEKLEAAAGLGAFTLGPEVTPWYGANLDSLKEAEDAHRSAVRLARKIMPKLVNGMEVIGLRVGIEPGKTLEQWGRQLRLMNAVQESLDIFTQDVFSRPVDDLIAATGTSKWRTENGIEMGSLTRSRLRRVIREYIRNGVQVDDLHEALKRVAQQRVEWKRYATTSRLPSVSPNLRETTELYNAAIEEIHTLSKVLATTPDGGELMSVHIEEVRGRFEVLAEEALWLSRIPEINSTVSELKSLGLGDLVTDLSERKVHQDNVSDELELAWWQSVLDIMLTENGDTIVTDGDSLRKTELEFRLADQAHVDSGGRRLAWRLAEQWKTGVSKYPEQAQALRSLLHGHHNDVGQYWKKAPDLMTDVVPIWMTTPLLVPHYLGSYKHFDAVLFLDGANISMVEALGAIARADQVIVFGDEHRGEPSPFVVAAGIAAPSPDDSEQGADSSPSDVWEKAGEESILDAMSRVVDPQTLSVSYAHDDTRIVSFINRKYYENRITTFPEAPRASSEPHGVSVEFIENGRGLPTSGVGAVESVDSEVRKVRDYVIHHAQRSPQKSLAVVASNAQHAENIKVAISKAVKEHPELADFLQAQTKSVVKTAASEEPFTVVTLEQALSLVRDRIIFSFGYGQTPHGRIIYDFGKLSREGGEKLFARIFGTARERLHIIASLAPHALESGRLRFGAADFYEFIAFLKSSPTSQESAQSERNNTGRAEDALLSDLAERVRKLGFAVQLHPHQNIDLAVLPAQDKSGFDSFSEGGTASSRQQFGRPLAIQTDASRYLGGESDEIASLSSRNRIEPQRLEQRGWQYLRLWTIEVFADPQEQAKLIAQYAVGKEYPKG